VKKQRHAVEVRVVQDPHGNPGVLLQLPPGTSWLVMDAAGARRIAEQLTAEATTCEIATEQDPR
jgi:hypothetical protein